VAVITVRFMAECDESHLAETSRRSCTMASTRPLKTWEASHQTRFGSTGGSGPNGPLAAALTL
jgi:hypothetical protein